MSSSWVNDKKFSGKPAAALRINSWADIQQLGLMINSWAWTVICLMVIWLDLQGKVQTGVLLLCNRVG
jgi:hypothetical protein